MGMALEWVRVIGSLVVSWPFVLLVAVLLCRKSINRLIGRVADSLEKGKVGPVEFELRKLEETRVQIDELSQVMAESRLLELEVVQTSPGGPRFTSEQRARLDDSVKKLQALVRRD